jgi:hypothetical protein
MQLEVIHSELSALLRSEQVPARIRDFRGASTNAGVTVQLPVQGDRSRHEFFLGIVLIGLVKSVNIRSKSAET